MKAPFPFPRQLVAKRVGLMAQLDDAHTSPSLLGCRLWEHAATASKGVALRDRAGRRGRNAKGSGRQGIGTVKARAGRKN
jgi:hypothetical protein